MITKRRRPGLSGGEAEAGGAYRAAVAGYVATQVLRGEPLRELDLMDDENGVPTTVELETDDPVDDIGVSLRGGGRMLIQSKRTVTLQASGKGSLVSAAEQWKELVRIRTLDPNQDRLVLVAGKVSGPIRDLSAALNRRRKSVAAGPSEREERALQKLLGLLDDLEPEQRDVLLRCAVVWELEVEDETAPAAINAQHALGSGVVVPGQGLKAWRALCDACRRAAHTRLGFDTEGLLRVLRSADLQLITDSGGLAAARLAARLEATDRYRSLVNQSGQVLDLLGLGAELPPIPLEASDALVRVRAPDEKEAKERDLPWSVRRQGRLVLLGLPGSGKSTMLKRTAGYFAQREDWPLPVYVKLDRLARRLDSRGFRDGLLDVSIEQLELDSLTAALVRDAIDGGLSAGRVALFLDALDEAREHRHAVVQRLRQFLNTIHEDVEVVLSTREVAYADAHTLGFPTVVLSAPRNAERTVRRILETAAEHRQIPELEQQRWVRDRYRWVQDVLESNASLRETPLVPVLLALIASKHADGNLPTIRATILASVLRDVVDTWESAQRRQGEVQLGVLAKERAVEALIEALPVEGDLLDQHGSLGREVIEGQLATHFQDAFSLGPADASVAAREAVACWDEAGIFVAASDGLITPRLRLFAEIGAAMHAHDLADGPLRLWVAKASADEDRAETLRLAAGLNDRIAELLCEQACREFDASGSQRLLFVVAEAAAEGAVLTPESLGGITQRLLKLLPNKDTSWRAALMIARLPVPVHLRNGVREVLERRLPERNLPTVEALATLRWQETGPDADRRLEAVLLADSPVSMVTGRPGGLVDSGFAEALVGSAQRLRSKGPSALESIGRALGKGSISIERRLEEILIDEGRGELVARYRRSQMSKWKTALGDDSFSDLDIRLLGFIRDVGEPKALTQGQARRLDELCDFITSLHIPDAPARSLAQSVYEAPERVKAFLSNVAPLTGLDLGAVAAEAEIMDNLLDGPDEWQARSALWDGGVDQGLECWHAISDPQDLRHSLRDTLDWHEWPAVPAAIALSSVPQREEALEELDQVLDGLRPWARLLAARIMIDLEGENVDRALTWLRHEDPLRRRAAAEQVAAAIQNEPLARTAIEEAMADPDEGVRVAALEGLDSQELDEILLGHVRAVAVGDATGWLCIWCGEVNQAEEASCASCNVVGPDAAKAARELLRAAGIEIQ